MAADAPAIGIDLGTTYSCVGVWHLGKVEIIANEHGNRTTPSCVAFTDTERLVGEDAKNQVAMNSTNTIFDVKRLMGCKFREALMKHWPLQIVSVNDKPRIQITYKGEVRQFSPEEISSMILAKMKGTAEAFLGKTVTNAVITVPAYFNNAQRQATHIAGTIAGLNVLRIINEPTAAAIAYGLKKRSLGKRNVLIFDLGGGTFDVSILFIDDGILEIKSTAGNTRLGGVDFDNRIIDHFVEEFARKHKIDLTVNKRALTRLRRACERAKRTLSSSSQASVDLDSLCGGIDFCSSITRVRFEELNSDLFHSTMRPVEQALFDAKLDKDCIDDIVLVGGSTRIPKIQSCLQEFFNRKELNKSINPDEAVAYGAAVQAQILHGGQAEKMLDFLLLDVTPLSLGIREYDGNFYIIIKRSTTIPTKHTELFDTVVDFQNEILFEIFEGERPLAADNHFLGKFTLSDIPSKPKGVVKIDVIFEINEDGILNVMAVEKSTKITNHIVITKDQYLLSKKDIARMIYDADKHRVEDEQKRKNISAKSALESYCFKMRAAATDTKQNGKISKSVRQVMLTKCNETIKWLDSHQLEEKEVYDRKLKELEIFYHF